MPPRFQFSLRALLVAMLVLAAFFGGMAFQRQLDEPAKRYIGGIVNDQSTRYVERMVLKDGTEWTRELGDHLTD